MDLSDIEIDLFSRPLVLNHRMWISKMNNKSPYRAVFYISLVLLGNT